MPEAQINGISFYYQVHGRGAPLVLIAGMGADHRSWFPQVPTFKHHFRVITFDGRGVGRTGKPRELYNFESLAEDVVGLMDALSVDDAHVLGESLGGIVAQELAITFPQRVRKLVLANTAVGTGVDMQIHPDLMNSYGLPGGPSPGEFDPAKVDINKAMRAMIALSFNSRFYRLAMTLMATIYVRSSAFKGMPEQIKAISDYSTLDRLHLIRSPTLVITGTADRIVPPSMSDILSSRIPNARLIKIEGGSHALHVEMRRRFNQEVLDFLREP